MNLHGISFIVAWIAIVLLYLVHMYFLFTDKWRFSTRNSAQHSELDTQYFLFLSLAVIARCLVSFILVQFFFTPVFMLQFFFYKRRRRRSPSSLRNTKRTHSKWKQQWRYVAYWGQRPVFDKKIGAGRWMPTQERVLPLQYIPPTIPWKLCYPIYLGFDLIGSLRSRVFAACFPPISDFIFFLKYQVFFGFIFLHFFSFSLLHFSLSSRVLSFSFSFLLLFLLSLFSYN